MHRLSDYVMLTSKRSAEYVPVALARISSTLPREKARVTAIKKPNRELKENDHINAFGSVELASLISSAVPLSQCKV